MNDSVAGKLLILCSIGPFPLCPAVFDRKLICRKVLEQLLFPLFLIGPKHFDCGERGCAEEGRQDFEEKSENPLCCLTSEYEGYIRLQIRF